MSDIPDRLKILDEAIHAVRSYSFGAIGVSFSRSEFEQRAPKNWPLLFGSIYTVACTMAIQSTAFWLGDWGCQMNVLYVFEDGHKFEDEAHRLLTAVGRHPELRAHCRYRQHIFEPKTELGLQAADLYAWIITKSRSVNGGPIPKSLMPFTEPLLRCVSGTTQWKISKFEGAMLDRFFDEATTRGLMIEVQRNPRRPTFR